MLRTWRGHPHWKPLREPKSRRWNEAGPHFVVTGCAGFIGSHLTEALLGLGADVTGIDCFTPYYARIIKEENLQYARRHARFRLIECDLASARIPAVIERADGVFHLAAEPGVRTSWGQAFSTYVRNNVLATQRLLEAARQGTRFILASSSSVYGNAARYPTDEATELAPISPYGVTKTACEALARAYSVEQGIDVVTLRYFTIYGPRQRPEMAFARILSALVEDKPFEMLGDGRQSRDFTYVDDAISATLAAFVRGRSGGTYNVGFGGEASLADVVRLAESLSGGKLRLKQSGVSKGDVERTAADISRIRSELGWTPVTSLEQGLHAQMASLQTQMPSRAHEKPTRREVERP
jgi:UDP-glucuronate 4-epimerase